MESTEKIRDLIKLLSMNQDHLCYELTSLAAKVDNFLDDREMILSGQLLSVRYAILTEENANETIEIDANVSAEIDTYGIIEIDANESVEIDTHETIEIGANDVLSEVSPGFDDSRFALV